MRLLGLAVAIWLGAWSLASVHAATAADAILTQASAALASGQYREAQTFASSGLAEAPLEALIRSRLLVTRGLAQQAQGAADEALVDFTTALQGDVLQGEERARALFARGLALDGKGRLELAVGDYTAALIFAPRAAYALNNRANVHRRQGRFAEARRDYAAALEATTPNPQYPYYGFGQIAEAEGDIAGARVLYSRALTADPGFQLARERLAALGTAVEGARGVLADPGIIILRPPPPRDEAPVILRSPPPQAVNAPVASKAPSRAVPPLPVADQARPVRQAPVAAPGWGAPLRPAIVENAAASGALVQLGAWRSEAEARDGWAVAQAGADGLLDGRQPVIVRAELPGRGIFYRLRVPAAGPAPAFCAALAGRGLACLPVRE